MIIYNKVNNPNSWTAKINVRDSDGTVELTVDINSTAVASSFEELSPNKE